MGYISLDTTSQRFTMLNSRFDSITVWVRVWTKIKLRVKQAPTGSISSFPGRFRAIIWNSKTIKYKVGKTEKTMRYFRGYFWDTLRVFWWYFDDTLRVFHSLKIIYAFYCKKYIFHVYLDYPGLSLKTDSNDRPKIAQKTICAPCWGLVCITNRNIPVNEYFFGKKNVFPFLL